MSIVSWSYCCMQHDQLLAWYCLSQTDGQTDKVYCVVLRVIVAGWKLYHLVPRTVLPIYFFFRHFCYSLYQSATTCSKKLNWWNFSIWNSQKLTMQSTSDTASFLATATVHLLYNEWLWVSVLICRDVYYDNRRWFQNPNVGHRWWEGEATDLGHGGSGEISYNHFHVCHHIIFRVVTVICWNIDLITMYVLLSISECWTLYCWDYYAVYILHWRLFY